MSAQSATIGAAPRNRTHFEPVKWAYAYSTPRKGTGGNFEEHDYVQSLIHATGSGFAFMGAPGIAVTAASALTSTFAGRHTHTRIASVAAGVLTGSALAGAMGYMAGAPLAGAVAGGLLGGYQAMSGDHTSRVRDAAEGALLVTAFWMPGTSKIAGSLGAGIGATCKNPAAAFLLGGAVGGAVGAVLGATGFGIGGMWLSAGISALGGAFGAIVGPPLNQGVRNLSNDAGQGFVHLARRAGFDDRRLDETTANAIGAFPATFLREGVSGFVAADFNGVGFLANGLVESIETAYILVKARHEPPAAMLGAKAPMQIFYLRSV